MQNTANNLPGIKNSWSLLAFAKTHGKMSVTQPREFTNSQTGEQFTARSCAFEHPTEMDDQGRHKVCFVAFSRNLGELSPAEIAARKEELNVVEFENGNYSLCAKGSNSWEEVDLGI
jgi:hypothetical protein